MSLPKSLPVLLVAALAVVACRKSSTPTAPTPLTPTLNVFEAPLDRGSFSTFLFSLSDRGTIVQAGLEGVTSRDGLRSLDPSLTLTLGTIIASDCDSVQSTDRVPTLQQQMSIYMDYGLHCVKVSDPGTLTEAANVVVRVIYPPLGPIPGTASPETFTSSVSTMGRSSRSFTAGAPGTATVTLTSLGAPAPATAGLAIGVQGTEDNLCHVSQIVDTGPGGSPQISAPVDAGIYCVSVFDIGQFTEPLTDFSVTITHP